MKGSADLSCASEVARTNDSGFKSLLRMLLFGGIFFGPLHFLSRNSVERVREYAAWGVGAQLGGEILF